MPFEKTEVVNLKLIQTFGDLTHVEFDVNVPDASGELLEGGTLTVMLSGDIRSKSLAEIEKLARIRLKSVVEQFVPQI